MGLRPAELVTEKLIGSARALSRIGGNQRGLHLQGHAGKRTLEQLEWFGKEVMPTFKNQVKAATPAD